MSFASSYCPIITSSRVLVSLTSPAFIAMFSVKNGLFNATSSLSKNSKKMSSLGNKFALPEKYKAYETTVWAEFRQLALETNPLNLGLGFPDFAAPEIATKSLAEVANSDNISLHQYSRGLGHIRLVNALSKLYSQKIGRKINPMSEIITTAGAFGALYCSILGHIQQGDEVILIEPFFDCYASMVAAAGGKPVFIPLRPTKTTGKVFSSDWKLDVNELKNCFSEKTKAIVLNTPHNPIGKVFTSEELTVIADLCIKYNVLCISDEVYEWMVYEPYQHIRVASLPGMWERTITIGSAGKSFSVTGWRVGWAYGPANLIRNLQVVHENMLNSINTPAQEALAMTLEYEMNRIDSPEGYLVQLANELKVKRDFMASFISEIGMVPIIPEGGYFMVVDWTPLANKVDLDQETDKYKDYSFAKWASRNLKIQGLPPSAFFSVPHKHLGENYIRYCFIKKEETLKKAAEIFQNWAANS